MKHLMKNIIDSVWLTTALLLVSLILATTLPQAAVLWWLLALVAGGVAYAGRSLDETDLLLTPRDLLSLAVFSIGLGMGLVSMSSGPLAGIQFVAFIAGVLAVRLVRYKGLLPWIR